jgi:hypothetical protein
VLRPEPQNFDLRPIVALPPIVAPTRQPRRS